MNLMNKIRIIKIFASHFLYALFSDKYCFELLQDESVGFYLRRTNKQLYDDLYAELTAENKKL